MTSTISKQESVSFVDQIGYKYECGDCTMCCQGFLPWKVYEYTTGEGNPCHFVKPGGCGGGCSIYDKRPEICQQYLCAWVQFPVAFPQWMKPNKSDVLLTYKNLSQFNLEDIPYLQMKEGYNTVKAEVLNWVIRFATTNNYNLEYEVNKHWYYIGTTKFMENIEQRNLRISGEVTPPKTSEQVAQDP